MTLWQSAQEMTSVTTAWKAGTSTDTLTTLSQSTRGMTSVTTARQAMRSRLTHLSHYGGLHRE